MFSSRTATGRAVEDQTEIEFAAVNVDEGDLHANFVAETKLLPGLSAHETDAVRVEAEIVLLGQRADVDEAIDRNLRPFAEQAEAFDAGDDRVELLADSRGHERQQFDLRQFAFCLSRSAFGVRTVLAEDGEFGIAHSVK